MKSKGFQEGVVDYLKRNCENEKVLGLLEKKRRDNQSVKLIASLNRYERKKNINLAL